MKKVLIVGRSGCGKTTLLQRLREEPIAYQKTQCVEYVGGAIDTPGEYMEHKKMFRALAVTCMDAEEALLLQACTDTDTVFFQGMQAILNMPVIGVVSKTDLAQEGDLAQAAAFLELAGAEKIFLVSAYTDQGVAELREYLEKV